MKEIHTFDDIKQQIPYDTLPNDVLKDVLLQVYLFEACFDKEIHTHNKVMILDNNETIYLPYIIEQEEQIEKYIKILYIVSDTGEGIVVYKKIAQ